MYELFADNRILGNPLRGMAETEENDADDPGKTGAGVVPDDGKGD